MVSNIIRQIERLLSKDAVGVVKKDILQVALNELSSILSNKNIYLHCPVEPIALDFCRTIGIKQWSRLRPNVRINHIPSNACVVILTCAIDSDKYYEYNLYLKEFLRINNIQDIIEIYRWRS